MTKVRTKRRRSYDGSSIGLFGPMASSQTTRLKHIANGRRNKLFSGDRASHDWYRFILSFPPQLVREYLHRFGLGCENVVLDPFCGTGTTLVECKKLGIRSIGFEAHPMVAFASHVKTDWSVKPGCLKNHVRGVARDVRKRLDQDTPVLRTLPEDSHKLLLKNSISPIPLHKTLVLLDRIRESRESRYYQYEALALANALVSEIGNLHFGPEVGVRHIKEDAPVIDAWLENALNMATDLEHLQGSAAVEAKVWCHDSRQMPAAVARKSIDAVITSPPYPNEKDYTRTTRLETVILGFAHDMKSLRRLKQNLLRSNTRNVYKDDDDDRWIDSFSEIKRIADKIESRRIALGKTSGFERQYSRVTKLYFGGMARHFADLREFLRPGARLAYVVGDQASYLRVMIRTGQLLAKIAASLGYEVEGIDLFRTRWSTTTKAQLREEIVVLKWPG